MSTFHDVMPKETEGPIGSAGPTNPLRLFFIRRGAGQFPSDLQKRIAELNVRRVVSLSQSESDGNISLCLIYE